MSWRSQKKKRAFFVLFILFEEHFLTLVFYLYGGPQVSRQKKKAPGKKEIVHGKRKNLPTKETLLRQKQNARGKKEIVHGKRKKL